jgi:hypothetical protein
MPTSVHIPQPLLAAIDRKARALRVSRNRFIIGALQRELSVGATWSPGFLERLEHVDQDTVRGVDEMLRAVKAARRNKRPVPCGDGGARGRLRCRVGDGECGPPPPNPRDPD